MKIKYLISLIVMVLVSLPAFSVISDHEDIALLDIISQGTMDAVGQQKWLFNHASVGANLIDGMRDLHSDDPNKYQLNISSIGYTGSGDSMRANDAPGTTVTGTVYECNRGNPGWVNKLNCFSNSINISGWNKENDKVDFAMDKFCWIDPYADTNTYIGTMNYLAATYPQTRFVWMTIPLVKDIEDSQQNARNSFNKFIRLYCADNDIDLLDIADIEAHDTNDVEQIYVAGGVTNQKLWAAYTYDTGHLNSLGRQRVAKGWYSLAAQNTIPEPCLFVIYYLTFIIYYRRRFS